MPITDYEDFKESIGFKGQCATANRVKIRTGVNASSSNLDYGVAVSQGSNSWDSVSLPDGTNADIRGVVYLNNAKLNDPENPGIKPEDPCAIATEGDLWVRTDTAVSIGDSVYLHTGAGTDAGVFTNTAGTNTIELSECRWLRDAEEGVAPCQIVIF